MRMRPILPLTHESFLRERSGPSMDQLYYTCIYCTCVALRPLLISEFRRCPKPMSSLLHTDCTLYTIQIYTVEGEYCVKGIYILAGMLMILKTKL